MSVGSIQGSGIGGPLQGVGDPQGTAAKSSRPPPAGLDVGGAMLSRKGQFLSQIVSLSRTDPAQAQQMLGQLAQTMRQRASEATGDAATRIGSIADVLQQAADTGDLSKLLAPEARPAAGPLGAYQQVQAGPRVWR